MKASFRNASKSSPVHHRIICTLYNCPMRITCLLFGNEHKPHHRLITGVLVMAFGTMVGEVHMVNAAAHLIAGGCSRFVEAMGSVPIIEHLGKIAATSVGQAAVVPSMTSEAAMEMEAAINGGIKPPVEPVEEHSKLTQFVS